MSAVFCLLGVDHEIFYVSIKLQGPQVFLPHGTGQLVEVLKLKLFLVLIVSHKSLSIWVLVVIIIFSLGLKRLFLLWRPFLSS